MARDEMKNLGFAEKQMLASKPKVLAEPEKGVKGELQW